MVAKVEKNQDYYVERYARFLCVATKRDVDIVDYVIEKVLEKEV